MRSAADWMAAEWLDVAPKEEEEKRKQQRFSFLGEDANYTTLIINFNSIDTFELLVKRSELLINTRLRQLDVALLSKIPERK